MTLGKVGIDDGAHAATMLELDVSKGDFKMLFKRRDVLTAFLVAGAGRSALSGTAVVGPSGTEAAALRSSLQTVVGRYGLPAISAAVSFQGKLLWADAIGATPKSLFRIASLSKPITAVTLLEMISNPQGGVAVSLSSKVFGPAGLLTPYFPGITPCDPRFADITVEQLLSHRSGCPSYGAFAIAASNLPPGAACASDVSLTAADKKAGIGYVAVDPMAALAWRGKNREQLIAAVLQNMRLEFDPGTSYAYSNFGYLLLGRIIEHYAPRKVSQGDRTSMSQQSYAEVCRSLVLDRIGIRDMDIALPGKQPRPGEVAYVSGNNVSPYVEDISRMDSHGGWLATPSDLVNFAWNGVNLLPTAEKQRMAKVPGGLKPGATVGYGLGWQVNVPDCNLFHTGFLTGTEAFLVRAASGFAVAYVTNDSPADYQVPGTTATVSLASDFDGLWWDLLGKVASWQVQRFNRLANTCPT